MALFVDLEDEDIEPPQNLHTARLLWSSTTAVLHRDKNQVAADNQQAAPVHKASADSDTGTANNDTSLSGPDDNALSTEGSGTSGASGASAAPAAENSNWNSMSEALGCYPVAAAIASSIDLNTLDSLARTCRQIRAALLQFRKPLLASTLHCTNEDLPVDGAQTLRYRARTGNWYYMEDTSRAAYEGKSGRCARDMVSECRRCGIVVCRNCTIKPPAPIVLRDRHRRLCDGCAKAPLALLVKPPLPCNTPLHSGLLQRAMCCCASEGVWLCQPCGRSIRSADSDYRAIWKWRSQYGGVIGLGTGIGEGDRGVVCGREDACCCAKELKQETDCDAEDAREAEEFGSSFGSRGPRGSSGSLSSMASLSSAAGAGIGGGSPLLSSTSSLLLLSSNATVDAATIPATGSNISSNNYTNTSVGDGTPVPSFSSATTAAAAPWSIPVAPATQAAATVGSPLYSPEVAAALVSRRTPSPAVGPGYVRHEVEGIGGVVKRMRVKMVRVGACVHDWEDELARGEILGREISGRARSWCGWCWRVIPSRRDIDSDGGVKPLPSPQS